MSPLSLLGNWSAKKCHVEENFKYGGESYWQTQCNVETPRVESRPFVLQMIFV